MAPEKNFEEIFRTRYESLNAEQKDAVDTLVGPVMVIAGPGTGKTTVLTLRIANILRKTETKPERILALTFTESGTAAIRNNVMQIIGERAYRVEISTFHGFANRIIGDYPDYFPEVIGAASITEIDQVSILQKLLDVSDGLKLLRPFGDRYYYLRDILSAINELKRQGVAPAEFAVIVADEKKDFYANPDLINQFGKYEGQMKTKYATGARHVEKNGELAEIYAAYQKELRVRKQYDYSDMIMQVAQVFSANDELCRVLQDSYDYFLIDEHQDTNDAQNKIIEMLVGGSGTGGSKSDSPNLFVVGDEKQAIFRFQGASLENFLYFKKKYHDVALIMLKNNYRSTQAILDAAQEVSPREVRLMANAGHVEKPAHLAVVSSPDAEYYFIARKIKELVSAESSKGTTWDAANIAILYRDNRDVVPLAQMLEKIQVPFVIESDQDVLHDVMIKKLVRILRAVQHFGTDAWLIEALHVDFLNIPAMDIYKLAAFARRERKKIYDVMRQAGLLEMAGVEYVAECAAFFEHLSKWKRAAKNATAPEAFEMIVRESGFLKAALAGMTATETIAKLHVLFDLLRSFVEQRRSYSLDDFFAYLDLMEEHGISLKGRDTQRVPGRVRLMTAHRAKGLEFSYVFIMNAVDRKWGSRFHKESITLPEKIYGVLAESDIVHSASEEFDDERNIFYVALTRAKQEVFITMSATARDGKEQLPTKFIADMKSELLERYDVSAYEADFAANRADIAFAPVPEKTPELKDKKFLNELFEEQGLSVTAINNFLECPWHYFYVNLVRIPEAPNKHLSFGNAIHVALKQYFDLFDEGEVRSGEYLVRCFEHALAREPLSESDYDETLEKGRRILPLFFEKYHTEWKSKGMNEVHIDGIESGGVLIKGNLDRVELLSEKEVRVIDYKTGKAKSRNEIEGNTKDADGNYKRQLTFYKLLLNKEGRHEMREGVLQFIEPDERGNFHREAFMVADSEIAALETQIADIANQIRNLSFWNDGCHEPDCKYCELRKGINS